MTRISTLARILLAGVAGQALLMAPSVSAQDDPSSDEQIGEVTDESSTDLAAESAEEGPAIIVTGSRIRRQDFDTPNPVLSVGTAQVEESGTTNLTDFLSGIPALQGSSGSDRNGGEQAAIGFTGLNLLDLRNLGTQRTLVLVDGRRHVAGTNGTQAVDINTIPSDLVERVDILTGGASAIYGADGVSGVVNFVMKHNFEGITARGQYGVSDAGGGAQKLAALTAGTNFSDGRGNVAIAYEHGEEDRLPYAKRKRYSASRLTAFYLNPDDPENQGGYTGPNDNGIADNIPLADVRYFDTNREGGIDIDFDGFPDYLVNSDGNVVAFDGGKFVPDFYSQGGNATHVSDYRLDILPKINRDIVNVITHYEFSPEITLFAEGKYANIKSFSLSQPTYDYYLYIPFDNPFIPASVAAIAPYGDVLVNRDNFDLGIRGEDITRETWRGVIGLRGDLTDNLNYEVSYTYGQMKATNHYVDDMFTDRFYAAIDVVEDPATGQPTCRVNLDPSWTPFQPYNYTRNEIPPTTFQPGECLPLNIFGENVADPAAIAWVQADTTDREKLTQNVVSASVSGDLANVFTFPGGGALGFAVGAEYRRETSSFDPDDLLEQGLTYGNKLGPVVGKYDVFELFSEVRLPILQGMPFAENLEVGGAVRYSDYSTIGTTWAWKVDANYSPVRDIAIVGTYSTAVRAPNIGELFAAPSQTFLFITDPCNQNQVQNGTQYRAANCASLLTSLGADPSTYRDTRSSSLPGSVTGNPDLSEETAKTWTVGAILQPSFVPGLSARFDWYDIKIKNAINTATANEIAGLCVDQPTLDNPYCAQITRQNGTGGTADPGNIVDYTLKPFNVAAFRTAGLDVNLNYRLITDNAGIFTVNLIGNYLDRLTFISVPGAPVTNIRGEAITRSPKYTVNADLTWTFDAVTINYGLTYFSKTSRYTNVQMAGNPDIVDDRYRYLKERWQHDIYARFDVSDEVQVFGGVNNLFDQKPSIGTTFYPVSAVGRFFYFGVKVGFDDFKL
ncbi:TonB-dependent receptor plug domain-containing protein [Croceibacterium salegens]|nr:TonB-dependent receptor [Croceibacterium salegens]